MTPGAIPPLDPGTRAVLARLDLTLDEDRRRAFYQSGWWRARTVLEDFELQSRLRPAKTAIVTYRRDGGAPERISYAELANQVRRLASQFLRMGVEPGDVVSAQLPNWWQFAAVALAAHKVGAILNPILPIHRRREIRFIMELLQSRVYVLPRSYRGFDYVQMVAQVRSSSPYPAQQLVLESGPLGEGTAEVDDRDLENLGSHPDGVSDVQFTSGTTGEPKGVAHTHNTLYARIRALQEPLGLTADDVVFMPSPLAHSTGFVYGCMTALMLGMTAVYQDVWDPAWALGIIEAERPTWTFGSTTFLVDLLAAHRHRAADVSSLRYFVSGGAAIPAAVVRQAGDQLGTRVIAVWGMTENGAVTVTQPGEPDLAAGESDGQPCSWMELKVADPETGEPLPPGREGALFVRGASQMLGYVKRPALTRALLGEAGWFDTGDIARLVGEDHLRITGRSKDLIIRGGENLPVAEIESLLYEVPAVAEVALVGYPDARLGERMCAVVVPQPGASLALDDLTAHLDQAGVSKTYWPERFELRSELPRTASGKVQKYKLRESLGQ